jgi:hypothetical protein
LDSVGSLGVVEEVDGAVQGVTVLAFLDRQILDEHSGAYELLGPWTPE